MKSIKQFKRFYNTEIIKIDNLIYSDHLKKQESLFIPPQIMTDKNLNFIEKGILSILNYQLKKDNEFYEKDKEEIRGIITDYSIFYDITTSTNSVKNNLKSLEIKKYIKISDVSYKKKAIALLNQPASQQAIKKTKKQLFQEEKERQERQEQEARERAEAEAREKAEAEARQKAREEDRAEARQKAEDKHDQILKFVDQHLKEITAKFSQQSPHYAELEKMSRQDLERLKQQKAQQSPATAEFFSIFSRYDDYKKIMLYIYNVNKCWIIKNLAPYSPRDFFDVYQKQEKIL